MLHFAWKTFIMKINLSVYQLNWRRSDTWTCGCRWSARWSACRLPAAAPSLWSGSSSTPELLRFKPRSSWTLCSTTATRWFTALCPTALRYSTGSSSLLYLVGQVDQWSEKLQRRVELIMNWLQLTIKEKIDQIGDFSCRRLFLEICVVRSFKPWCQQQSCRRPEER